MTYQLQLFLCAVQFLTRLPTPHLSRFQPEWISRSTRFYPLVGQIVGALCALAFLGAGSIWKPAIAGFLAVAVGIVCTGAFHEDGLADTADGLAGGQDRTRRLEIIEDSRLGTFGVLALLFVLSLKVLALAALPPLTGACALVAAHGLARASVVVTVASLPFNGDPGRARHNPVASGLSLSGGVRWYEIAIALALALWPLAFLPLPQILAGLSLGVALALAPALAARRLIGGYTGDVLGATEQMFELGFILGVAAVL